MRAEYLLGVSSRLQVRLYEFIEMYREENIVRGDHFCTFTPRMQIAEKSE
jgi:hypothetical protein